MTASTQPSLSPQRAERGGPRPASVVLFVASTDNSSAQQRALDALNRHSGIIRAGFAPGTTRLIRVDYRASYTSVAKIIDSARFYTGVYLRPVG